MRRPRRASAFRRSPPRRARNDPWLELIETQAALVRLTLPRPAARPEPVADGDDFPYLPRYPGTELRQSVVRDEPLDVTSGADAETVLAGQGYREKSYTAPPTLSRLAFAEAYRAALAASGWDVKSPRAGAAVGEQPVVAHYGHDGRDLWAVLSRSDPSSDQGARIAVADLGAEDWARRLAKDCRLPLYGIHFDFNRATLRPDSQPELERVRTLLAGDAGLTVEVQGHTDDVGTAAANDALSEARAGAVVAWLTAHGIAPTRLAAKGYGLRAPVVPNDSPEHRARNRRVELRRQGCGG